MSNTDGPEPPFVGDAKCLKNSDDGHEYNTIRPHSSLGYKPPTPETIQSADPACAIWKLQPDRLPPGLVFL
jgi:hypothetical protein